MCYMTFFLTKRSSRRSPKAHALLMSFLQNKTDQKYNTSKIYSMAASFILFSFLAFLSSLSPFFSCMGVHVCAISLSPALSHSPPFLYYFWPAPKELLNFILTYIHSSHCLLLEFLKFSNTERKKNYVINMGLSSWKVLCLLPWFQINNHLFNWSMQ